MPKGLREKTVRGTVFADGCLRGAIAPAGIFFSAQKHLVLRNEVFLSIAKEIVYRRR